MVELNATILNMLTPACTCLNPTPCLRTDKACNMRHDRAAELGAKPSDFLSKPKPTGVCNYAVLSPRSKICLCFRHTLAENREPFF